MNQIKNPYDLIGKVVTYQYLGITKTSEVVNIRRAEAYWSYEEVYIIYFANGLDYYLKRLTYEIVKPKEHPFRLIKGGLYSHLSDRLALAKTRERERKLQSKKEAKSLIRREQRW